MNASTTLPGFEEVWDRLRSNEGNLFHTISGLDFQYHITGNMLETTRTDYHLSKQDFARAFSLVPIPNPGTINRLVRGPSYIWAILHDERISQGEW
jgi:hypothetical protein